MLLNSSIKVYKKHRISYAQKAVPALLRIQKPTLLKKRKEGPLTRRLYPMLASRVCPKGYNRRF